MNEPLKEKEVKEFKQERNYGFDEIEFIEPMFKRKDIKSAVEWLKKELKDIIKYEHDDWLMRKIDTAFEDVIKKWERLEEKPYKNIYGIVWKK